jgi:hypothetical protein
VAALSLSGSNVPTLDAEAPHVVSDLMTGRIVAVDPDYLFIVGLPRTGTKLIENVLRKSPDIHYASCGGTFFMGRFLNPGVRHAIRKMGNMHMDANVEQLVDRMYAGDFGGGFWQRLATGYYSLEREALLAQLLGCDRSPKGIYTVILQCHTEIRANTIVGDKTPAHLYHVPELLSWFPQAKVVHTFRDPRAILTSEWLKRTSSDPALFYPIGPAHPLYTWMIVLHVTVTWLYAVRLHRRYVQRFPHNYQLIRFEDLVGRPEESVSALCRFLDVEFHSQMLTPCRTDSSYSSACGTGFDTQALTRWKGQLRPWMRRWVEFWAAKPMRNFGYR